MYGCPIGVEPIPLPSFKLSSSVEAAVREVLDSVSDVPSMTVGIVYDQELIFSYGNNYGNPDMPVPDENSAYNIGSVSKLFTALAVLIQRDAGHLHLDEEISDLKNFPRWGSAKRGITWRDLLSHRAGLQRETPCASAEGLCNITTQEVIQMASTIAPIAPLNSRPAYSNYGFALVGNLAAEISGMDFITFVEKKMFDPLRMPRSGFPKVGTSPPPYLIPGFEAGSPIDPWVDFGWDAPSGGIYSTVSDLQKLVSLMFRNDDPINEQPDQVIDGTTVREWMDPVWVGGGPAPLAGYGLPWEMIWAPEDGRWLLGKRGSVYGYTAQVLIIPELKIGVIILINRGIYLGITDLALRILDPVLPYLQDALSARTPVPTPPPSWNITGHYRGLPEEYKFPGYLFFANATIFKKLDDKGNLRPAIVAAMETKTSAFPLADGFLAYSEKFSTSEEEFYYLQSPIGENCKKSTGGPDQWLVYNKKTGSFHINGIFFGVVYHKM
jgi:CubicO group peptidase (beta-lactamase class C family)